MFHLVDAYGAGHAAEAAGHRNDHAVTRRVPLAMVWRCKRGAARNDPPFTAGGSARKEFGRLVIREVLPPKHKH
jgi:hypothetical protein